MGAKRKLHLIFLALFAFTIFGCSNVASNVQADLDTDPRLSEKGITAKVIAIDNGYATIKVSGFSERTSQMLNEGNRPGEIAFFFDSSASVLASAEKVIMQRPEVKAVIWKAD